MSLVTLSNVTHAFGSRVILDGATLAIEPGEKIGLVGRNGQGKTTLMRVMLGAMTPDAGSVQRQRGMRVGYLAQDPDLEPDDTVRDAAERAFATLHDLHVQLNDVYEQMAGADDGQLNRLLRRQSDLEARIEAEGGYAIDHKIDATLHGLSFNDEQFNLKVHQLSGGQKNRLGLAKLLLESPDLLLLDEPTNHLDIAGRQWLEQFLADEFPGAVIVVSHDRWLLDRVVSRIIEVERAGVRDYPGNYHKYLELREQRQLTQARVYDKQQTAIRKQEQFIRKYKAGQRAKQARGRAARLERFKRDELVDRPVELDVMKLNLPRAPRSGEIVARAEGISKSYGDLTLFDAFDFTIYRGDRIGIIGPNGVGKTTLVRCLLGEIEPDAGRVRLGTRLAIGYYRQIQDHLDQTLSVVKYLQSVIVAEDGSTHASEQQARSLAGMFLFSGDEQDRPLGELSGGERSRAVLAGLVASAKNLLVMDEPTNHLDIPSAERLEQVLSRDGAYEGTLLLISHDRALLDATCDKLIIFEGDGSVRVFEGTYHDLLWQEQQQQSHSDRESKAEARRGKPRERQKGAGATRIERSAESNDGLQALSISKLEQRIEAIEQRRAQIDELLLDPAVYSDGQQCNALKAEREALGAELQPLEAEWARRAEQM